MKKSLLFFVTTGLLSLCTLGRSQAQGDSNDNAQAAAGSRGLISMAATGQVPGSQGEAGKAATPAAAPTIVNPDSVYINPEVRPQFVGGDRAFVEYLMKSIRYPEQALQRRVSGRVFVSFVLSATGKVQDAHVVKGPGSGLNEEALRLIWTMPAWEPGRVDGQPVRVACTLPINFNTGR
ncbi:MAG: energy transducer TonB [Bacteroidota bacterium]|nr:energy transducer TonB [Bacteroidota bacterium]